MPLRCLDSDENSIHAFELADEAWSALRAENKKRRHLRLPCCPAQVILKTSPLGLRFFAHSSKGSCTTEPETEEHLLLKTLIAEAVSKAGWSCATEVAGCAPSGYAWTADVLAEKGKHKIAFEIQWSSQTTEETLYRQERYRESGIRCLWLFRRTGFPISEALPAVCIGGDKTSGFDIRIPLYTRVPPREFNNPARWTQIIPLGKFFEALFERRFRYGAPDGVTAEVTVNSGVLDCWKQECRARTRIVTFIDVAVGPHEVQFDLRSLGRYPELLRQVLERIPPTRQFGAIKPRYSGTMGEKYMSNGCYRCDALVGAHFEHDAWYSENQLLARFPIAISGAWREAIEAEYGDLGWGIH